MQGTIEKVTALAAVAVLAAILAAQGGPAWLIVLALGGVVLLAENTAVIMHPGTAISPGFMLVMAAIAVTGPEETLATAALVGACNGVYLPNLRDKRFGITAFNCGQFLLASSAAAAAYLAVAPLSPLAGAVAAAAAYGVVNTGLVLPHVALKEGERPGNVWNDMKPAMPNYLAFGLLGLLLGLVAAELGPLSIVLVAVPMGIARWTFRSFERARQAHEAAIRVFVHLIETKDPYTAGHSERVARYSGYIAEEIRLRPDKLNHLRQSALMHDVGKVAVPSGLLNKPGKLTEEEWAVVRRHNEAGIEILGQVDFMRTMAVVASDTHGHFDAGAGSTPSELLLEAHIVAVADAFDSMTSTRAYRRALDQQVAFDELRAKAGTQFNPRCVEALIRAIERRGEQYGAGFEEDAHAFATPPPVTGVGSAGLGDLEQSAQ